MKKKGEAGVGSFLIVAITIIVALSMFSGGGSIADNIGKTSQTSHAENVTYTMPTTVGGITELTGQELLSTPLVINRTANAIVTSTNYTIYECVKTSDGLKGICMKFNGGLWSGASVNLTYDYAPAGYIDDAAGRSIAAIIVILVALGIGVIALGAVSRDYA